MDIDRIPGNISRPYLELGNPRRIPRKVPRPKAKLNSWDYVVAIILAILALILMFFGLYFPLLFSSFDTKFMNTSEITDQTIISSVKRNFLSECIVVELALILWIVALVMRIVSILETDLKKRELTAKKSNIIAIVGGVLCGIALFHYFIIRHVLL